MLRPSSLVVQRIVTIYSSAFKQFQNNLLGLLCPSVYV